MNKLAITSNAPLAMSSREIAELCEKEHKNVIRDIRSMLITLYGDEYVEKNVPVQYRNRRSEYIRENSDSILEAVLGAFGDGSKRSHEQKQVFSWSRDARGYVEEFRLDYNHTLTLVAGYNVKLRKRIIDRWQELEDQIKHPALPGSYVEASLPAMYTGIPALLLQ
jgi:phage regulator Rha-like protein